MKPPHKSEDTQQIVFDEKIVGVWFLVPAPKMDRLAAVREIKPELEYELTYRFRYYRDEKIWDSKDERSWYRVTVQGTRSYLIASARLLVNEMRARSSEPDPYYYELLNDGDLDVFLRRFQDAPFAFVRLEGKEAHK